MGYITKEELIDELKSRNLFTEVELCVIKELITIDKIYNDTVLTSKSINGLEQKGLLKRFYEFCEEYSYFPKWVSNIKMGKDNIE